MIRLNLLLILSIILHANIATAKEFSVQGSSYAISEQPFIEMIEERLQSVDIDQERIKMQQKAQNSVNNPKPVKNIQHATEHRSYLFDPTYTLQKDIILPCGKLLHKAGTKVNPLDHIEFDRRLIFIDGDDRDHISWLNNLLNETSDKRLEERVILVKGGPLKLKEELDMDIYFDQAGVLTKQFGIRGVPAIVIQEGKQLRIEELII